MAQVFTKLSQQSPSLSINIIRTCAFPAQLSGTSGQEEQSCSSRSSSASVKALSLLLLCGATRSDDAVSSVLVISQRAGLAPLHCTAVCPGDVCPSGFPNNEGSCSLRSSCGSCQSGKEFFEEWKVSGKSLMLKFNRQILPKQLGEMVTHISF